MAINKTMRKVLKALSYGDVEIEAARHLANLKKIDPLKIFYKKIDYNIYNEGFSIPTRIFFPNEELQLGQDNNGDSLPAFLYLHGGGWVTNTIDNYERICARLAKDTHHIVIAVDYRLAPEHKFPIGLEDCYAVAKALYTSKFILNIDPDKITIIGDSAGGNLAAALCLMARDRGEFMPKRQILIYPATYNDYTENSPFLSVHENGTDFLLTARKMCDYLDYYIKNEEDRQNPYLAPLLEKNLSDLPATLIITAEYDPLRDEGEAYGQKLKEAGNQVEIHRIKDALHGFFSLGIKFYHVQESFTLINQFLRRT